MYEREFVEPVREPLALLLPRDVHAPYRIIERLAAHGDLRGERLFAEVHKRTADLEVFGKVVFPRHAEERFALHTIIRVAFEAHVHRRASIENTLIEYAHDAGIVVHGVVRAFRERLPAGGYEHRPARYVHRAEVDLVVARGFVLSRNLIFVLLGNLPRNGACGVVKFLEHIAFRHLLVANSSGKVLAERLDDGEVHAAARGIDGVTLHIVEIAVGVAAVVVVEAVKADELYDFLAFQRRLGDVREIYARGVA